MVMLIPNYSDVTRIEEHIRRALVKALAHEDCVADAARARLVPGVADIDAALAERRSAAATEAATRAAVHALEERCRLRICAVRDDVWTALGRPRQNRFMALLFPGGVATYTSGAPARRPVLIQVLQRCIASCAAPQLTDSQRDGWVAELEVARTALLDGLATHAPADASAVVAEAAYRTAVQLGRDQLRLFKRDLENMGLSQAQIFDIIPDATPAASRAAKAPAKASTSAPAPTPDPDPASSSADTTSNAA